MGIPVEYLVSCHQYEIRIGTQPPGYLFICDNVDGGLNRAMLISAGEITPERTMLLATIQGFMLGMGYCSKRPHEDDDRLETAVVSVCAEALPEAIVTRLVNVERSVTSSVPAVQKHLEKVALER